MSFSLFGFGSKAGSVLAVDIGSAEIKIAEISRRGKGFFLDSWVVEPLPDGAVEEGNVERQDVVVATLSRALAKLKSKQKRCVMALPSTTLLMKKVRIPESLSEDDVSIAVESELAAFVPFDLSEASIDWVRLDSPVTDEGEEYVVVAARKEKVDERVAIAEQLGLDLVGVDGSYFAAEALVSSLRPRGVSGGGRQRVDLVVDVGHRRSRVYVCVDGVHVYEREIQQGCQSLTVLLSQANSCSMADAESMKVKGRLRRSDFGAVLESFNAQMLQEVSRAVQLFYTTTQFNWVDSLWLAGRGAVTPGLLECLRERGGFNAALLDGLPMFSGVGSDSLKEVSTSMFLAFGLGLNFFLVQK